MICFCKMFVILAIIDEVCSVRLVRPGLKPLILTELFSVAKLTLSRLSWKKCLAKYPNVQTFAVQNT